MLFKAFYDFASIENVFIALRGNLILIKIYGKMVFHITKSSDCLQFPCSLFMTWHIQNNEQSP